MDSRIFLNAFVFILAIIEMASSQNVDPCNTHGILQEIFRSVGYHVDDSNDALICDRQLTAGWYMFTSKAGNQMPESCVQPYHCGTHAPIWMNGTHPTVADGIVTRDACGNIAGTCCMYKTPIKVKNCGAKGFVYELQPTRGCSLAYCAGNGTPCRPDQYSLTGLTPCSDAYPKLPQNPQISNPIVLTDTFEFQCKIPFDTARTDVAFEVTWLFNSKPDHKVPPTILSGNDRVAHLDQHFLKGHLGESISCAVSSYFINSPQRRSPKVQSPDYWMGIRIEPAHLVVGENDPEKDVKLVSTIPIVCSTPDKSSCKMEIYLDNNNHQTVGTSSCTQTMRPSDWNSATNQAVVHFNVLAQRDFKNDGDQNLVLHFNPIFSVDVPDIWNNYQIPYLQVLAKDKETSVCICSGDPHCLTLDENNAGKKYYNYYKVGEFVMYKSTSRPFEVHARTVTCNAANGVTCNCAVAAREGNDQVIIDLCHHNWGETYPRVSIQPKDGSHGTVVKKDPQGNTYYIYFLSGAWVKAQINGPYMDISIQAPEDDFGKTQGLCGTFDKNTENDLTGKDGHVHPRTDFPDAFTESWRIPPGLSYFDQTYKSDPKWNNQLKYCNCDQAKHLVDCRIDNKANDPAKQTRCQNCQTVKQSTRRRRDVTGLPNEDSDNDEFYLFDYGYSFVRVISSFPTRSGRTESSARALCHDALSRMTAIKQCQSSLGFNIDSFVEYCVEDIKYISQKKLLQSNIAQEILNTDDLSYINGVKESAVMSCMQLALKNVSLYDSRTGQPPAFITTDLCHLDCNGNGNCVRGTCHCNSGFTGADCSIDATKPPTINEVIKGNTCDIRQRPCRTIYVAGHNMLNFASTRCHLREMEFRNGTFASTGKILDVTVQFESSFHVGCNLPVKTSVGGKTVVGYKISLTNDGHQFSNEKDIFIYDSHCMTCAITGSCTVKSGMCMIDGNCRIEGDKKNQDSSYVCDPRTSSTEWTAISVTTSAPLGGLVPNRFDIWTNSMKGCECIFNTTRMDCACCDEGACQCGEGNEHQCVQCGHPENCGTPLPAPDFGMDGFTLVFADCRCFFDETKSDCACCQNDGVQCGPAHKNQCVEPGHPERCGSRPDIYGPPFPQV